MGFPYVRSVIAIAIALQPLVCARADDVQTSQDSAPAKGAATSPGPDASAPPADSGHGEAAAPGVTTRGGLPSISPGMAPVVPLPVAPVTAPPPITTLRLPLKGYVDLHTHPLSNLGFGGKFVYGGVDVGSMVPAGDPSNCGNNQYRAKSEAEALGNENPVHGGWGTNNGCGDTIRNQVIHVFQQQLGANDPPDSQYNASGGYPSFVTWPRWDDLTRQKMWVEWIRRAYISGLRVMVALAVNTKTLGDMTRGPADLPDDDLASADLQIAEIKSFVGRHPDFMAIAYSSNDLYNIVASNRLAVVLGVEIDNIGNLMGLSASPNDMIAALGHLYTEGVRYYFPIHLVDNPFGGTAVYEDAFNLSNGYEEGSFWNIGCAAQGDGINYVYRQKGPNFWDVVAQDGLMVAKWNRIVSPPGPVQPACPTGNVNNRGLTVAGEQAIVYSMKSAMLIDIDHMSQKAYHCALTIASNIVPGGYPVNSGHNSLRGLYGGKTSERNFTIQDYQAIFALGGMAGVGSAKLDAFQWLGMYLEVAGATGAPGYGVPSAFGTDINGLEFAMPPRVSVFTNPRLACEQGCSDPKTGCAAQAIGAGKPDPTCVMQCKADCDAQYPAQQCIRYCGTGPASPPPAAVQYSSTFPPSTEGNRTFNYNLEGVGHYGMLADFLQDVRSLPNGAAMIDNNLMNGADYFYRMWARAEAQSAGVPWPEPRTICGQ